MNYYGKNREALLKEAHNKYHNTGGKRKKDISTKICQKMKKT